MSMTAVPISIRLVRAPTAASSGNGEASWRAKWWTRKYAPSAPSSSAATANSIDWSSVSDAERTCEYRESDQWPNDRNPMRFIDSRLASASAASGTADGVPQVGDAVATDDALGHRSSSVTTE